MNRPFDPRSSPLPGPVSRRHFLTWAAALGGSIVVPAWAAEEVSASEKLHANTGYRTPRVGASAPRVPEIPELTIHNPPTSLTYSHVTVSSPCVAMTFDDGPQAENTPRLLDMLRERNIRATFFMIGENAALYPSIVRRVIAEGHEIGNHSYTHRSFATLSDAAVREEILKTNAAIERGAGVPPATLRPPYGALKPEQRKWIHEELGMPIILWSVDPLDWKRPGPAVVSSRILAAVDPGAIVLSHDLHAQTVDAMPATLDALIEKGYKFYTVSELIAMKPVETTPPAPAH